MISTKGRYAIRFMIDLAEQEEGLPVPLVDVASRQEISKKYLETVVNLQEVDSTLDQFATVTG